MANLFYGVSTSLGDAEVKEVTIYNPLDIAAAPGDIFAVYFTWGNTCSDPSLSVTGVSFSSGQEDVLALATDTGDSIKTTGTVSKVDYMWQSGEVCLFVLVTQQHNSDLVQGYDGPSQTAAGDTLYYMLVRGTRADSEYYGLTKLFTDSFGTVEKSEIEDFNEWLFDEITDNDTTTSATPYLIKLLARFLIGEVDETSELDNRPAISYSSASDEGITLGTLTVGGTQYDIMMPILDGIERTSQIINDADICYDASEEKYYHNKVSSTVEYIYVPVGESAVYSEDVAYYVSDGGVGYIRYDINGEYQEIEDTTSWERVPDSPPWYIHEIVEYVTTEDVFYDSSKIYYIKIDENQYQRVYPYEEVSSEDFPDQSPKDAQLYVYIDNVYVRTNDETWVEEKLYYQYVGDTINPKQQEWYEHVNKEEWSQVESGTIVDPNETYYLFVYPKPYDIEQREGITIYVKQANTLPLVGNNFITDVNKRLYLYAQQNDETEDERTGIYVVENPKDGQGGDVRSLVEGNLKQRSVLVRNVDTNKTYINYGYPDTPMKFYGLPIQFCLKNTGNLPAFTIGTDNKYNDSSLTLRAPTFVEGGVSLKNKYSPLLTVKLLRIGKGVLNKPGNGHYSIYEGGKWVKKSGNYQCVTVAKNSATGHCYVNISIPNYYPLGIIGYNISYASANTYYQTSGTKKLGGEKSDATYQYLWELYLTGRKIEGKTGKASLVYDTKNLKNDTARFFIDVYVLCSKII